jgi:hypothetical protein
VSQRFLLGVDAGRRDHFGDAVVGKDHLPFAVVNQVVMKRAQQAPVAQVGASALGPGSNVVCFAPGWWPVTTTPAAPLVADGQGEALVPVEQPLRRPLVQHPRLPAQDGREEAGVAG